MIEEYVATGNKIFKRKVPQYKLLPQEEVAERQNHLGRLLGCYYGIRCTKCHGVYPAIMTTPGFDSKCYYMCMVCGREGQHADMPHLAEKLWNDGVFKWIPENEQENYQLSFFDLIGGV